MAFDAALVERVRDRLADREWVTDKRMFGTFAFLTDGNLTVCVRGDDLMVRVGRSGVADALARPGARDADMTGRPMKDWVVVDGAFLDDDALAEWIARACDFVSTLPPK
jgi:TfoX/Sxy family transcriptional regulator of competence genes